MVMKVIAVCVLAAAVSVTAASAKTVTTSQGNANDQSVVGVAGPAPVPNKPVTNASSPQPSKKALKKSKIKAPPPLHDPN
jgi:hypothetical protein